MRTAPLLVRWTDRQTDHVEFFTLNQAPLWPRTCYLDTSTGCVAGKRPSHARDSQFDSELNTGVCLSFVAALNSVKERLSSFFTLFCSVKIICKSLAVDFVRYLNDGTAAVKVAELPVGSNSYTLPVRNQICGKPCEQQAVQ